MTAPAGGCPHCGDSGVDVHSHSVPRELMEELERRPGSFPSVSLEHQDQGVSFQLGDLRTRPVAPPLFDLDRRIAWLDQNRLALQVVGPWMDVAGYGLPADEGADWARFVNAGLAGMTDRSDRLAVLATVPLQDPEAAGTVLGEALGQGFLGVMIGTTVGETTLDDPWLTPFWEAADEAGALVYLHPPFSSGAPAYRSYGLENALARVVDSTLSVARLISAGVVDRCSRVKLVVSHGGGALPYVLGRLARNAQMNPELPDPVGAFRRLWFDSVVFRPEALEFLVTTSAADRVLLGSDYPFPIGDLQPRVVVEESSLAPVDQRGIAGGNACGLFGLARWHERSSTT